MSVWQLFEDVTQNQRISCCYINWKTTSIDRFFPSRSVNMQSFMRIFCKCMEIWNHKNLPIFYQVWTRALIVSMRLQRIILKLYCIFTELGVINCPLRLTFCLKEETGKCDTCTHSFTNAWRTVNVTLYLRYVWRAKDIEDLERWATFSSLIYVISQLPLVSPIQLLVIPSNRLISSTRATGLCSSCFAPAVTCYGSRKHPTT